MFKNHTVKTPDIGSGTPRELPNTISTDEAFAFNQNELAIERTEFAKIRTDLAIANSRMSVDRTHLSYLRTIVSLLGSGATLYEALPLLGVTQTYTVVIAGFLLLAAAYFIYKDATTYPKQKRALKEMELRASKLAEESESHTYRVDDFKLSESIPKDIESL